MKQDQMPEAISSVTYTLETPNGFNILFTVRGDSGTKLLKVIKTLVEPQLIEEGYKPQKRGGFTPKPVEYVEGEKCPECGKRLAWATKKDGSKYKKCETNKWNKLTSKAEGCPYIDWCN